MGLRYTDGVRGIAGETVGIAPPPPAPPQAPISAEAIRDTRAEVLRIPEPPDPAFSAALRHPGPSSQHIRYLVTLFDLETQVEIHAEGATLQEVTEDAAAKYDAALPVQPLVWQDGTPLGGMSLSLLQTALDQHEAWLTAQSAPREVWLALGRLKGALGMEMPEAPSPQE